jgi:hypothetical protein
MQWSGNRAETIMRSPWLGIAGLLLVLSAAAVADIRYKEVVLYQADASVMLDLVEEFQLNQTLSEALDNGVRLVFSTDVRMARERQLVWDKSVMERRFRRSLSYHPLAGLYRVDVLDSDRQRSFATLQAALAFLGEIRELPLIAVADLDPQQSYAVEVQTSLLISELPLPLQTKAYVSADWYFSSKVWEWRFRP